MTKDLIQNKKGVTLIELIVSMGIFAIIMTLTVSFFIVLQGMQRTYRDKADLHQEGRILSEIISRYTREAGEVIQVGTDICASNTNYIALKEKPDRKSTRLNSSHIPLSRMPSSA